MERKEVINCIILCLTIDRFLNHNDSNDEKVFICELYREYIVKKSIYRIGRRT